jgi:hypothetical protein
MLNSSVNSVIFSGPKRCCERRLLNC